MHEGPPGGRPDGSCPHEDKDIASDKKRTHTGHTAQGAHGRHLVHLCPLCPLFSMLAHLLLSYNTPRTIKQYLNSYVHVIDESKYLNVHPFPGAGAHLRNSALGTRMCHSLPLGGAATWAPQPRPNTRGLLCPLKHAPSAAWSQDQTASLQPSRRHPSFRTL